MEFMKIFKRRLESSEEGEEAEEVQPVDFEHLDLVDGLGPPLTPDYYAGGVNLHDFLVKWTERYGAEELTVDAIVDKVKELKQKLWEMPMYTEVAADTEQKRKWYKLWNVDPIADVRLSEIYWCTDVVLFRYLRSYKYKVGVAFLMLKRSLAWRRFRSVDTLSPDSVGSSNTSGMLYRKGYDIAGRPLVYFRPRDEVDIDRERQALLLYFTLERTTQTVLLDHGNDKVFVIVDLNNWSLSKLPTLELVIDTVRALSEHYTDVLHEVLLVDPPMLMDPLLQMIKAVLDSTTAKKIVIKHRGSKLEAYLKSRISERFLEESLGGNSKAQYDHDAYWRNENKEFNRFQERMANWVKANEEEWKKAHESDAVGGKAAEHDGDHAEEGDKEPGDNAEA